MEWRFPYAQAPLLPDKTKELKHGGYVHAVSPYSLAWNGDNYYLIGFSEKHGSISNFRADRMTNLKLMDEEAVPLPEGFSVSEYCAKLFLMVGGKEETVEILCDNAVMNNIIDRFGEQVQTEVVDNAHFKATVSVIPGSTFYAWIFNYAGKMKLLSPVSVVLDFQKMLKAF